MQNQGFSKIRSRLKSLKVPLLILLTGILLTSILSWEARQGMLEQLRQQFVVAATMRTHIIQDALGDHLIGLEGVHNFYNVLTVVTRKEFAAFVAPTLKIRPGIQAFEWIPRVAYAERARFEAEAHRDGLQDYQIYHLDAKGHKVPPEPHQYCYPVYYVEPLAGNEPAAGLDLGSNPARLAALEQAADTGQPVATERLRLVQETSTQAGFLIFIPVYRQKVPLKTVEQRRIALQGFVLGVFRAGDAVETVVRPALEKGLLTELIDLQGAAAERLLYRYENDHLNLKAATWRTLLAPAVTLRYEHPFTYAGRQWMVAISASPAYVQQHISLAYWLIPPMGALLTLLLALYLWALLSHKESAEQLVVERSAALRESEKRFKDVTDNTQEWVWEVDAEGKYTYTSPVVEKLLGYKPEEVLGKYFYDFFLPEEREQLMEAAFAALATKQPVKEFCNLNLHKDGSVVYLLSSIVPVLDNAGNLLGYRGADIDITERQKAEEELKTTVAFLENVIASSVDPLATVDEHGRFTRWNQAAAEAYGYSVEGLAGHTVFDLYADNDAMERMLSQLRRDGFVRGYEIDMQEKDKAIAPFSLSIRLLRDENGKSLGSVCVARDLTETRKALAALGQTNARLQTLVEESDRRSREATLIISLSESLQSCLNAEEAYRIIAGFAQKLFSGQSGALFILAPSKHIVEVVTAWGNPLVTEEAFAPDDCWAIRRGQVYLSGQEIPCRHLPNLSAGFYVCLPLEAQGQAFGLMHLQGTKEVTPVAGDQLLLLARTVADHISLALANLKLREVLRHQVTHDHLTGLFNRRYLDETLEREIHRVRRKGATLGVIMMDLDHFKRFNDLFGHEAGDSLLESLGKFLQTKVRMEDVACRYGGEEFVLVMPEASLDITQQRAEEIRREIPHLQVLNRGHHLESSTISLGVAIFPDHGATGEDVLRAADDAMYKAKAAGRNRIMVAGQRDASLS